MVCRRAIHLVIEGEQSSEFRRFLREELLVAMGQTKMKLILNSVMLVSLLEFHFSESFAVFDEKREEKEESIKFVARLIESEKVRISDGSSG